MELQTEIKFNHVIPKSVSEEGLEKISDYLFDHYKIELPEDWPANWVIPKGEYAGTFPKRLANWAFKEHGVKLSPQSISEIGNLARANCPNEISYTFDFTCKFDWEAGDFADGGSCYWQGRKNARIALQEAGCYAIRFYNPWGRGWARAWVWPCGGGFIVFNAYGMDQIQVARILADYLGMTYGKIESLCNDGSSDGDIWINADGKGYHVRPHAVKQYEKYDLGIEVKPQYTCERCNAELDEDHGYNTPDGENYCESCYDEYCFVCYRCHDTAWRGDSRGVGDEYYCKRCFRQYCFVCGDCGEAALTGESMEIDGNTVCQSCADGYPVCDYCKEITQSVTRHEGESLCNTCLEDAEEAKDA